jgi:GLPGLI family protein
MKKFVTVIAAFTCIMLHAQTKQGTIIYERKIDVYRRLQDEQMKAMVPQFQTANYELLFKDSISVYKPAPKDDAPDPFDGGGGNNIVMRFGGPGSDGILYRNFSSGKLLQQTDLDDKKYVINDTIQPMAWKLADETQTILNHVCKKATSATQRGSKVIAWYAEDMPVPAGPENFCGLPGAILKVDIDSAGMVFTAQQIQPSADSKELKEPADGKQITRADFTKKLDEVLGPPDSQGRRIIRN